MRHRPIPVICRAAPPYAPPRCDGVTGRADRNRFKRDADALGSGAGEQSIQPRPRRRRGVDARNCPVLDARGPLFGRRQQFQRKAVAADPDGLVVFGLGTDRAALFDCRRYIAAEPHLGAQLGARAVLAIARRGVAGIAGGALFGFLILNRRGGGADLAFQVRGVVFDCVEFGSRFVVECVGNRQLGNPARAPLTGVRGAGAISFGRSSY